MAKEFELSFAEFAFLRVECCSGCLYPLQDGCKSDVVLLSVFAEDEDIIHQALNSFQIHKDLAHAILEMLQGARYPDWKLIEAIAAVWGNECGEKPGLLGQWYLPEPAVGIKFGEVLGSNQLCQGSSTFGKG